MSLCGQHGCLILFLDDKHRAGGVAGRVEDTSRPERVSRALLMLDGIAGMPVRPGTLSLGLGGRGQADCGSGSLA